jgi:hypothetical protein
LPLRAALLAAQVAVPQKQEDQGGLIDSDGHRAQPSVFAACDGRIERESPPRSLIGIKDLCHAARHFRFHDGNH